MKLKSAVPFRLPVLQSRWVIRHGKTYFGVHPRRKSAGCDDGCVESHICIFRKPEDARSVARVLRAHKALCHEWPDTAFDGALCVAEDLTVTNKHRPLCVSEVCVSVFESRLQAYGIGAVEVLGHEFGCGLLSMEVRPLPLSSDNDNIIKGLNLMMSKES